MSDTMQALVFAGPALDTTSSRVAAVPVPQPRSGEVTVDVQYAGVNFKDVMARRGDSGYVSSWPFVPGLEAAGRIRAIGPDVSTLAVGDRVIAYTDSGGLAEVASARAEMTVAVPANLSLRIAAAVPGALTTAALLLRAGSARRGDTLLVHSAAGGVGQALVQFARLGDVGAVLGTVGRADRVAAAQRAGYDAVFVRGPDLTAQIHDRTAGHGIDVILDPQGTMLLDLDLEVAAPGARIVLFGNASGEALSALPTAGRLFAANASIGGFSLAALVASAPHRVTAAMRETIDSLAAGHLDVEITDVNGLSKAAQAQQALAEGRGQGKQIVRVRGERA